VNITTLVGEAGEAPQQILWDLKLIARCPTN
jgi:hypothetical protein